MTIPEASVLLNIFAAGALMALFSFGGAVLFIASTRMLERLITPVVALSAGALLGGALLHLLPEALEVADNPREVFTWTAVGFAAFLLIDQFLHHRPPELKDGHAHAQGHGHEEAPPYTKLVLFGDAIHNFIDGIAVGAAFLAGPEVGWVTFLAVALHEIPQEIGDVAVLVHGGWPRRRALLFNVLTSIPFLFGALGVAFLSETIDVHLLLPVAAGSFLYVSSAGLIPEIRHEGGTLSMLGHFVAFVLGVALIGAFTTFGPQVPH